MSLSSHNFTSEEAITKSYFSEFKLSVDKERMAFLIGTYIYVKFQKEPSLSFGDLLDVFERVNRLIQGDDDTLERRARSAVTNLYEQGLLSLMTGLGGEQYGISPLGRAIAQHWENSEILTTQTLNQFIQHLRMVLEPLRDRAQSLNSEEAWSEEVVPLLRDIISDLIDCIGRRQHGMAQLQKKIQKDIQEKIDEEWLVAISSCEEMLKETGSALEELHRVILTGTDSVVGILDDINEDAVRVGHSECVDVIESLLVQMEAIRQWSDSAHEDWSDYYRNVHEYIRIHVRTDPNRQAAFRIKEGVKLFSDAPWYFSVPSPEPLCRLREEGFSVSAAQVKLPGKVQVPEIEEAEEVGVSLLEVIEAEVDCQISETGKASLVDILKKLAPEMSQSGLYQAAGSLVGLLAARGRPRPFLNLEWSHVADNIEVQDLTVLSTDLREVVDG